MSVFITPNVIIIITPPMVVASHLFWKSVQMSSESARKPRCSAFIFNFSDRWNQTTGGFVLIDLVGHVSAHGLDLNVPWVGIFRFICKPFLFWRGQGERGGKKKKREKARVIRRKCVTRDYLQPNCLSLSDRCARHSFVTSIKPTRSECTEPIGGCHCGAACLQHSRVSRWIYSVRRSYTSHNEIMSLISAWMLEVYMPVRIITLLIQRTIWGSDLDRFCMTRFRPVVLFVYKRTRQLYARINRVYCIYVNHLLVLSCALWCSRRAAQLHTHAHRAHSKRWRTRRNGRWIQKLHSTALDLERLGCLKERGTSRRYRESKSSLHEPTHYNEEESI